uniref:Uncharacterized protein n=1 Tax=viral metagenome TaxID=1070528 RepID=A0A6C0CII4_9ZZZZ
MNCKDCLLYLLKWCCISVDVYDPAEDDRRESTYQPPPVTVRLPVDAEDTRQPLLIKSPTSEDSFEIV